MLISSLALSIVLHAQGAPPSDLADLIGLRGATRGANCLQNGRTEAGAPSRGRMATEPRSGLIF